MIGFLRQLLGFGKPVQVTLIQKQFSWPDAGTDKCLQCDVERRCHFIKENGHEFKEA